MSSRAHSRLCPPRRRFWPRPRGAPARPSWAAGRFNPFGEGGRELFDCAAEGRIDAFYLSGGQIDGEANINLVEVGEAGHPSVRFPGSFGSAYLYFLVPKIVLFREEHSRRSLVRRVDFISAPGKSPRMSIAAAVPRRW